MSREMDEHAPPGHYATAGGTRYRVSLLPDRSSMRFVERHDARWRLVADLPANAVADQADQADVPSGSAFSALEPPADEVGMREWLATLEDLRDSIKRNILGLLRDYDTNRVFSSDGFDRDYDVDLAHSADAAMPVLVAIEDAIDRVRECCDRPRGEQGS